MGSQRDRHLEEAESQASFLPSNIQYSAVDKLGGRGGKPENNIEINLFFLLNKLCRKFCGIRQTTKQHVKYTINVQRRT